MRSNNYNMGTDDMYEDKSGNNFKMYTDDTTLYNDILSFEADYSKKPEPYKNSPPIPTDPWLVAQANVSDIMFKDTDVPASSTDIFGRLSPTMEQIANSLLPSEVTLPLIDNASFDVDIALDSLPHQNNGVVAAMESLILEPPGQQLIETALPRRRSERLSTKTVNTSTYSEAHFSGGLYPSPAHDLGATAEGSLWSLASNTDDADGSEANSRRRRRPRVSYSNLTEEEKYQRIRDLNNEASRQYRGRIRGQLTNLQEQELRERQKNKVLKAKAAGLERLRDEIKEYTYNFFREHVGNHGAQ